MAAGGCSCAGAAPGARHRGGTRPCLGVPVVIGAPVSANSYKMPFFLLMLGGRRNRLCR